MPVNASVHPIRRQFMLAGDHSPDHYNPRFDHACRFRDKCGRRQGSG